MTDGVEMTYANYEPKNRQDNLENCGDFRGYCHGVGLSHAVFQLLISR
jgi:hypothetical protein